MYADVRSDSIVATATPRLQWIVCGRFMEQVLSDKNPD